MTIFPGFWPYGLIQHARGKGKTHRLALLCKDVSAALVVRDREEATRIREVYDIESYSVDDVDCMVGRPDDIFYVDPDACGLMLNKCLNSGYERGVRWAIETMQQADLAGEQPVHGTTGILWAKWLKDKRVEKRLDGKYPDA